MTLPREAPGTAPIYMPPTVRRALTDLNRRFLRGTIRALAATVELRCSSSGASAGANRVLDLMAACPFTLFELCMLDSSTTESQLKVTHSNGALTSTQPYFKDQPLAQATLILGSQLAESSRLTLAMALGSNPIPHAVVRNTPIARLPEWLKLKHVLRVRWLDHPSFWSTLFTASLRRDDKMLVQTHCLGVTLLVSDLVRPDAGAGFRQLTGGEKQPSCSALAASVIARRANSDAHLSSLENPDPRAVRARAIADSSACL